jgi:hypothetical protein
VKETTVVAFAGNRKEKFDLCIERLKNREYNSFYWLGCSSGAVVMQNLCKKTIFTIPNAYDTI